MEEKIYHKINKVKVKDFEIGENCPLTVMTGPCIIESKEHTYNCAKFLKDLFEDFDINFVFKASFDKANRSSINSFRGVGIDKGLDILNDIKQKLNIPVVSDIHLPIHAEKAKKVLDIIQIPAFLCRQTDLLLEAGKTKKPVHVKKGQFMSPFEMKNVAEKIKSTGNDQILLTDRGTFFGYNNLITDFTSFSKMKECTGCPVGFDATHSVQKPGAKGNTSGGERKYIPTLSKAAIAAGINFLFLEAHPNPPLAKSDKNTVMAFDKLQKFFLEIDKLYKCVIK